MNCQYTSLKRDALLHIIGPDSLKFLQGQTSCDTRTVDPQHAVPGVFCTPKGRVTCDFLLCELGADHFAMRLRRDIRPGSSAAFGKYIIFSKADLDAERDDWTLIGVWGPDASSVLTKIFGGTPTERFGATSGEGYALVQMDEHSQHFECYLDASSCEKDLAGMAEEMQERNESEWETLQIQSGVARIELATVEEFVPQTLNYDLTGHISFNKGCYTGQEVVARLHYRGKPKRRTYIAELGDGEDCSVGTTLFTADSSQSVGTIVNSSSTPDKTLLLVAATATGAENGLHVGAADGPLLSLGELPYELNVG